MLYPRERIPSAFGRNRILDEEEHKREVVEVLDELFESLGDEDQKFGLWQHVMEVCRFFLFLPSPVQKKKKIVFASLSSPRFLYILWLN